MPYEALVFRIYGYHFFGSAAGFIGAIFKAKMAHLHIKRVSVTPPPPSYYCSLVQNIFPSAVVGCLFGATYENPALGFSSIIFIGDDRKT